MEETGVFKKNLQYRLRSITGKNILMGFDTNLELNEVAKDIWNNIDGKKSISTIIDVLYNEYDCSREVLERDVHDFISFLCEKNVVVREG